MSLKKALRVYMHAKAVGLQVIDSTTKLTVEVTPAHVRAGARRDAEACPFSLALKSLPGVLRAWTFRSVAFVERRDRIDRHLLPPSVRCQVTSFDRKGSFDTGGYRTMTAAPAARLEGMRALDAVRNPERSGVGHGRIMRPGRSGRARGPGPAGIR
jgi:hypothetical protein